MKRLFVALIVSLGITFGFAGTALASAPGIDGAKQQVCQTVQGQAGGACGGSSGTDISRVLRAVLQILSWIAGVAAVIMIVVSGLKYVTSGGDSSGVASAKQSLIYAIVGIIIVALAQVIVRFILGQTAA